MRLRESSIYIYIEEFIYSSKIRDLEESGGKRNYENPRNREVKTVKGEE